MKSPEGHVLVRRVASPNATGLLRRLAGEAYPAFLDSAGGPAHLRRWSVAAFDPFHLLIHDCGVTRRVSLHGGKRGDGGVASSRNPLRVLRQVLDEYAMPARPGGEVAALGLPAASAAIGFMGYEMGRHIERLPGRARRDIALPDMHWGFYDHLLLIDHAKDVAYVVASDIGGRDSEALVAAWLRLLEEAGADSWALQLGAAASGGPSELADLECTFSRDGYMAAVQRAIEYIGSGDIFQVNLSQRFSTGLVEHPVDIYCRLRQTNPAPYAAFLSGEGWAVLSSSPELFLDVRQGRVVTRPIKGTRPRRKGDEAFNQRKVAELLGSAKDAAELVMIVDLLRNDLGRVCDYGSVRVTEARVIEEYASVFHSVAEIEGRLNAGYDLVDLIRATFPGGSITGAPKVRAMEIIDELEPVARSVYTGAVGFIGFDGSMHLNIAIRTLIVDGQRLHVQVGGGIVADSTAADEYDETLAKARSMLQAIGVRIGDN